MDTRTPTHLPRRKRSTRLTLTMMGTSAFGLTACVEPAPDEHVTEVRFDEPRSFQSVEDCVAANVYTRSACEDAYAASLDSVPRFNTLEACEAEHGEGACTAPTEEQAQAASGGGSWFMPAMMGYMMGSMLSNTNRGRSIERVYQEPVYRNRQTKAIGMRPLTKRPSGLISATKPCAARWFKTGKRRRDAGWARAQLPGGRS